MELKDIPEGEHLLTGAETHVIGTSEGEDVNAISFILDGITYTVEEDAEDGYRSSAGTIKENDYVVKNIFPACRVDVIHKEVSENGNCEIIELRDTTTKKVVLEVGTDNSDDYYPSYVSSFMPEAMAEESIRKLREMVKIKIPLIRKN